ncbi:MAG: iron-sulfur cluster assembly scaffold protein [Candidatus Aminicenantes bacterium]|nr:MAG: iron-sulfur cluster assembly scaffold protein [Candidatus Aminicenantes bacterium]
MSQKNDQDLERFARELQEQIMNQLRQQYSPQVIERWQNPHNFYRLENPDGYAKVTGSCGDTMEMFLKIQNDRIIESSFFTDGCGTTIACGSMATELVEGKTFTEALALVSTEEILKKLGGLPEPDVHCAQLAAETMRRALADYLYQKKHAWKKIYRKIEEK